MIFDNYGPESQAGGMGKLTLLGKFFPRADALSSIILY